MRVSIRTVAKEAGVSTATASRALRGLPNVDPQTCEHVRRVAQSVGYVRDPLLSSTLAFVRQRSKPIYRETIAFIAAVQESNYDQYPWLERMYSGVRQRAAALGYGIEAVKIPKESRAQRTLSRQLLSRGIRGCIICPVSPITESAPLQLDMDWQHLQAVEIGVAMTQQLMPRVTHNLTYDVNRLLEQLRSRGYRRIGLAVNRSDEATRNWAIYACCLLFRELHRNTQFFFLFKDERTYGPQALNRWLLNRQPDALIVNGPKVLNWLQGAGHTVPDSIGVCRIDCVPGSVESGILRSYESIGQGAVNLLTSVLESGQWMDPQLRPSLTTAGLWHEGSTLRPPACDGN